MKLDHTDDTSINYYTSGDRLIKIIQETKSLTKTKQ